MHSSKYHCLDDQSQFFSVCQWEIQLVACVSESLITLWVLVFTLGGNVEHTSAVTVLDPDDTVSKTHRPVLAISQPWRWCWNSVHVNINIGEIISVLVSGFWIHNLSAQITFKIVSKRQASKTTYSPCLSISVPLTHLYDWTHQWRSRAATGG